MKYKDLYERQTELNQELRRKNKALNKSVTDLLKQLTLIKRRCKKEKLWLIAGIDPYRELTDEAQQGPLVNGLFQLAEEVKKTVDDL